MLVDSLTLSNAAEFQSVPPRRHVSIPYEGSSHQMSPHYTHVGKEALVKATADLPNLEESPPITKKVRKDD
jgi:hypothetical protein